MRQRILKTIALLGCLALAVSVRSGEGVAGLIEEGKRLLAEQEYDAAEHAFKKALKQEPRSIQIARHLGRTTLAQEDWGEANKWYKRVLKLDPEDLDAVYHRAICHRQIGTFKAFLFRRAEWDESQRLFEQVLAADSLHQDAIYQYAVLKRYRKAFEESILLGHEQVRLKPDLEQAQVGLFRLYQAFLDNGSTERILPWLRRQSTEHSGYFIGEALRRSGDLDGSEPVLRAWLRGSPTISKIPAYLSLARLLYQREEPLAAEGFVWSAVDSIAGRVDAGLFFEDIKYVVSPEELEDYGALSAPGEYAAFFRKLWVSRDPTPASNHNVRVAEHFRRMLETEEYYLFDGFRTWARSPDRMHELEFPAAFFLNDRFNDRGLVYLRHGEPADNVRTAAISEGNDSWFYGKTEASPEMIFHFVLDAGNSWRLAPTPPSYEGRETWDASHSLAGRGRRRGRGNGGGVRRASTEHRIIQQSRSSVTEGFQTDRHTWPREVRRLDLDSYVAFFQAPEGRTHLDLYYGVEPPATKDLGTALESTLYYEHGLAIHDLEWNPTGQTRGGMTALEVPLATHERTLIGRCSLDLEPDSCHAAFYLRRPDADRLGGWKGPIRVLEFPAARLSVSSILPAYTIEPSDRPDAFARDDLRVVPNPSKRFSRRKPVYVYFEIYSLSPDEGGVTSFTVEYTLSQSKRKGKRKRLRRFGTGDSPETSITIERLGDTPVSKEYLSLDLGKAGRGDFTLNVKVSDLNSGETGERSVELALF